VLIAINDDVLDAKRKNVCFITNFVVEILMEHH
jgi:hypothetical protein